MIVFLYLQLKMGAITIEQVPEQYKDDVLKLLETRG